MSLVSQSTIMDIELILGVGPSLDHPTLPVGLIAVLASDLLCCLKHFLLQNYGPSHSPSSNVSTIFLPQVECIMLLQLGSWHFSKFSSTFKHFMHSLHVMFIFLPFTAWLWFWMRWKFEHQNEIQNNYLILKSTFWVLANQISFLEKNY